MLMEEERTLSERTIPELVAEQGLGSEFKFADGMEVNVDPYVRASLPKEDEDKRAKALAWIRKVGGEGIIRHSFIIDVKLDKKLATRAQELLTGAKIPYDDKEDVHHSTYAAFIREINKKSIEVPEDIGVYQGLKTKIIMPKGD